MITEIKFHTFREDLAPYFKLINQEWINEMFQMEAHDLEVLDDPFRKIIEPGGEIYFADVEQMGIVGTCAVKKSQHANNTYELTKMGVLRKTRGQKIGEKLLQFVLKDLQQKGNPKIFLCTNSKCLAAIHLYQKNGFKHDPKLFDEHSNRYDCCDVVMSYQAAN